MCSRNTQRDKSAFGTYNQVAGRTGIFLHFVVIDVKKYFFFKKNTIEFQVREDDNLKWSHTKGSELHQGYHYAIQNLNLEVRRLSDHLKDKALYQATLEEHYNLISQLRNARKRVKAKLDKSKNHSRPLRRSSVDASKDEYLLASPNRNFSRDLVYNANGGGHVDSWSTFNNTGYSKIWKSVFH